MRIPDISPLPFVDAKKLSHLSFSTYKDFVDLYLENLPSKRLASLKSLGMASWLPVKCFLSESVGHSLETKLISSVHNKQGQNCDPLLNNKLGFRLVNRKNQLTYACLVVDLMYWGNLQRKMLSMKELFNQVLGLSSLGSTVHGVIEDSLIFEKNQIFLINELGGYISPSVPDYRTLLVQGVFTYLMGRYGEPIFIYDVGSDLIVDLDPDGWFGCEVLDYEKKKLFFDNALKSLSSGIFDHLSNRFQVKKLVSGLKTYECWY